MEEQPQNQHTHWVTQARPPFLSTSLGLVWVRRWVALPSLDCPAPVSPGHGGGERATAWELTDRQAVCTETEFLGPAALLCVLMHSFPCCQA